MQLTPNAEWSLASICGQGTDKLYTVQLEPVKANRHKLTGIPTSQLRLCCNHPDCKKHHLPQVRHGAGPAPNPGPNPDRNPDLDPDPFPDPNPIPNPDPNPIHNPDPNPNPNPNPHPHPNQAALPLFCDRCRTSLMQPSHQGIYHEETITAMHNANGKMQLRLCSTCHKSLEKKGPTALSAEVRDVHANPNPRPAPNPDPNLDPNPNPNPNLDPNPNLNLDPNPNPSTLAVVRSCWGRRLRRRRRRPIRARARRKRSSLHLRRRPLAPAVAQSP